MTYSMATEDLDRRIITVEGHLDLFRVKVLVSMTTISHRQGTWLAAAQSKRVHDLNLTKITRPKSSLATLIFLEPVH